MGCWVCPKCDEHIGLSIECIDAHVCSDEVIINRMRSLENTINELDRKLYNTRDGIKLFLSKISADGLNSDTVTIDRQTLDTLYSLVSNSHTSTLDKFVNLFDALYSSWLEASELFSIEPTRYYKVGDYKEKFEILRKDIIRVRDLMGFKEEREWKSAQQALDDIKGK